jgi:arylsulfatase A-like enzyme
MTKKSFPFVRLACAGAAASFAATGLSQAAAKPNVIFILTDDLGYGELGCYGQLLIKTPCLDQMAAEGKLLIRHYAGSPVCAPSRCILLTGKHGGHAAIRGNGELKQGQRPLPADEVSLGEIFKGAGYTTACIGKWGLGWVDTEGAPNRQGFDYFFGYPCQRLAHSYYPASLWRNSEEVPLPGNDQKSGPFYSHDLMTEEALGFIRKNQTNSFFLYLTYTIPHTKFQIPELGEYAQTDWLPDHKVHAAMISRLDRDCGALLAELKKLRLDEKTLVVFTSDNGAHGEGGTLEKFNASGDLRGKKRDLYEGGVRVPLLVRWPGTITAGTTSDQVCAFWDWLATFCDLTGQFVPTGTDGQSMVPLLLDQKGWRPHDYLYWEFHEQGGKQAVLQGRWKAVRLKVNADRNGPVELYDLEKDPAEKQNVAEQYPEKAQELATLMNTSRTSNQYFDFSPIKKL